MALRFATPEGTPRLISIYAPYILSTCIACEYTVPSVKEFAERIHSIGSKMPYLVYESGGIILRYTYTAPRMTRATCQWDMELPIYMDKQRRRDGIDTMLYKTLTALLKEQGYYNLYALIFVPNDRSVDSHRPLGFEQVGVYPHTGHKLGRWSDLAILEHCTQPQLEYPVPTKSILDLPKNRVEEILESIQ